MLFPLGCSALEGWDDRPSWGVASCFQGVMGKTWRTLHKPHVATPMKTGRGKKILHGHLTTAHSNVQRKEAGSLMLLYLCALSRPALAVFNRWLITEYMQLVHTRWLSENSAWEESKGMASLWGDCVLECCCFTLHAREWFTRTPCRLQLADGWLSFFW